MNADILYGKILRAEKVKINWLFKVAFLHKMY